MGFCSYRKTRPASHFPFRLVWKFSRLSSFILLGHSLMAIPNLIFSLFLDLFLSGVTKKSTWLKFPSHLQVLEMCLNWNGEKQSFLFFFPWLLHCRWPLRSSWTTMPGWARPLTLTCISSSWCEPPGSFECMTWEQGTVMAAIWLQMIKHQLKTRISAEFIFIPGFLRCLHTLHFLGQKE